MPKGSLVCHTWRMTRDDICLYLGPVDRAELQALITNRNTARKLIWRAEIVLATADGDGTFQIMRRAGTPARWRDSMNMEMQRICAEQRSTTFLVTRSLILLAEHYTTTLA
jgi:hypothetical protein